MGKTAVFILGHRGIQRQFHFIFRNVFVLSKFSHLFAVSQSMVQPKISKKFQPPKMVGTFRFTTKSREEVWYGVCKLSMLLYHRNFCEVVVGDFHTKRRVCGAKHDDGRERVTILAFFLNAERASSL
jgi:hypothetical protein